MPEQSLPTLLIIADNPSVRYWLKKHLDEEFFTIFATTESEALLAIRTKIDYIIIDSNAELYDALDLCKKISSETKKTLPILLITGKLKKSYRTQAKKVGVTQFINSQLDVNDLHIHIANATKAVAAKHKTEAFSSFIKAPESSSKNFLKRKFFLPKRALTLLATSKEKNFPTALLLLRIDHEPTDQIVMDLAAFIDTLLRPQDISLPAPNKGLAILLANTAPHAANIIAERLQKKIHEKVFITKDGEQSLTVSIAVSSIAASEQGFHKMMETSEKALKKALKAHSETNLIISLNQEFL